MNMLKMFSKTRRAFAALGGVLGVLPLFAATIEWEPARNIGADADISTEGDLVFAYNQNNVDVTINGVFFKGVNSNALLPAGALEPDVKLENFRSDGARVNTFCPNINASESFSAAYLHLLHGGVFNNAWTNPTITLLGLQPGEEYIVQIWVNDNRSDVNPCDVVIDGKCTLNSHPSGSDYGQFAIGRFRADSSQQIINLYSEVSPFFNSIQVRKLPSIVWGKPKTTSDDSDVNNSGTTLYAYHFINNGYTYDINGVTFIDGGYGGEKMTANVELTHDGSGNRVLASGGSGDLDQKTEYPDGVSDYYKHILGHALYLSVSGSTEAWMDLTLKNLVPGRKYAVQMWHVDARYDSSVCTIYQKIDGVRSLYAYDSGRGYQGHNVTGVFVADATTKTIRVRGYNISPTWRNNPLLNAFQVRDITSSELDADSGIVKLDSESAVRTDGEAVYAYTAANADLTVNGVPFAAQSSFETWGSGNVQLTGFTSHSGAVFFDNADTDFKKLLAGGVYAGYWDLNKKNPAPASLTFNGLEPFRPYLIQVFVNDSRSGTEARRVKFGVNGAYVDFRNSGVMVVRPKASSYTLDLWYTADSFDNISPQVNAVQVRRLSDTVAVGDSLVWNGGTEGVWTVGSTGWDGNEDPLGNPWTAENGVARDAVIGDGTTLTVDNGVTARNVIARGAVILNGAPTLMGEIMGGDVTVTSALTVDTIVKTADGVLTYTGARSALRQVTVNQGTLALTADDPSDLRRMLVCAPGALKLSGAGRIRSGFVSGILETSGALTVSPDVEFAHGWSLRRVTGDAMTVDCEVFDLSSIASVQIPDSAAFYAGGYEVLRTTGRFTGTMPKLVTNEIGFVLKIEQREDGEALIFKPKGFFIHIR